MNASFPDRCLTPAWVFVVRAQVVSDESSRRCSQSNPKDDFRDQKIERTPWHFGLVSLLCACVSCESDPVQPQSSAPRAPDDAVPESVAVTGGRVTLGTQLGRLRSVVDVGPFRIARTPVTVGQYRQCVDAGVCAAPSWDSVACRNGRGIDPTTYSTDEAGAQLPLTCATHDQAAKYCEWVGGTLPTAKEWLLAARGPEVRRFAWGDEWPTCERHFRAEFDAETTSCCGRTASRRRFRRSASTREAPHGRAWKTSCTRGRSF